MKCADILLSIFAHAGLVAGMMYGFSQDSSSDLAENAMEPVFFEILEESIVNAQSSDETIEGSVPKVEGPVPTKIEGPVPMEEGPVPTFAETDVMIPMAEPPAIEYGFNHTEEGPAPLPQPLKLSKKLDKRDFLEKEVDNEGSVPSLSGNEGSVPTAQLEQARVVSIPMALNKIVPIYPRSARRRGHEGVVTLEISVSDSGEVSDAVVIGGSGYGELDSAAVSAVRTAKFSPATEDGVQVEGRLRLTFEFKLK